MDERTLNMYLLEVGRQTDFAEGAIVHLEESLDALLSHPLEVVARMPGEERLGHQIEIFRNLHSLLAHAAMISKLFWPGRAHSSAAQKRADARGAMLRDLLDLDDGHVLRNRGLRDHLEHYDERLDDWAYESASGSFYMDTIAPIPNRGVPDSHRHGQLRWFDPWAKVMLFRGAEHSVSDIVDGIRDVRRRIVRLRQPERAAAD